MTIYLVRHGQTEWNRSGRIQGHMDAPLTEAGQEHARSVGRALRARLPDLTGVAVEVSPIGRARATAELVCQELGFDVGKIMINPQLAEHHMGNWQGLTLEEIDERFPGSREARAADKWNYVIPGGESYALIDVRARRWLAAPLPAPVVIAVTHEMLSRAIQGAYGGLTHEETLACSHPHNRLYVLDDGRIESIDC